MRILHFSDTHIQEANASVVGRRVEAMLAVASTKPVSAVLFTGDAAASGSETQYALFERKVVAPVLDALGIACERFFIVPGNHDVDRRSIHAFVESALSDHTKDPDRADSLWTDSDLRGLLTKPLQAFEAFCLRLGLQHRSASIADGHESIGIVCVNSAFASTSDSDRHRLVITRAQFDEAVGGLDPAAIRVGIWHHPLNWLNDKDSGRIQQRALAHLDFYCVGHFHEDSGVKVETPFGAVHQFQAPALCARDGIAGFLLYDIDVSHRQIEARCFRWDDRRGVFTPNPDFAPNGVWQHALGSRGATDSKALAVRNKATLALRQQAEARLEKHLPVVGCTSGRLSAEDRILRPTLVQISGTKQKSIQLKDIIQGDRSLVITGEQHSGKTTLRNRPATYVLT